MKLEVLLSEMNTNMENLDKKNITTDCVVINQCGKNDYQAYNNFKIYSYNELGTSNSRNRAIEKSSGDILLFCDDDVTYYENYDSKIIQEFEKNKKADVIFFNIDSPNRIVKNTKKNRKVHFFNCLRYGNVRMAIKRDALLKNNIKFNCLFGGNSNYNSGEDTLFIIDCMKNKLKLFTSKELIATVDNKKSSWFKGYDEKYFFDKGALYCAINKRFKFLLCFQHLLRHKYILEDIKFNKALKLMIEGSNSYLKGETYSDKYNSNSI